MVTQSSQPTLHCDTPTDVPPSPHIALTAENAAASLGKLAVAIINLLHELLERQAIRRMENGTLTPQEVENVGLCLMKQAEAIELLCQQFNVKKDELNLDLGPLGRLF